MNAPPPAAPPPAVPQLLAGLAAALETAGRWTAFNVNFSQQREPFASVGAVAVQTANVVQAAQGLPPGWKEAINRAVQAGYAPLAQQVAGLTSDFTRAHNSNAMGLPGKPLLPVPNAQGQLPGADFPANTNLLFAWQEAQVLDPAAWARLHRLLQFYRTLDPQGIAFVAPGAALPACPETLPAFQEAFCARVRAFAAQIQL